MRPRRSWAAVVIVAVFVTSLACVLISHSAERESDVYAGWKNGPPHDASFFPISVWLQEPKLAARYREAGINLYVGLWRGPTEEQLSTLKAAGMKLICHQNKVALERKDDETIVGWMHGDQPDNAQSRGQGKGYGPPIPPQQIVADYKGIRDADPTRPVLLNLGQGVAWDKWHGRGVRTNHPEDYPEYIKGCDIVSFDIYPVVHSHPDVTGNLWYVARGVERLREWSNGKKVVWNCIECTHIQSDRKPTPHQVKAEVWMSLIHGSMGLVYFVHEWKPKFNSHALLDDPEMLDAVTKINRQIHELAPVLNTLSVEGWGRVRSLSAVDVPIDVMAKRYMGETYLFAVAMRDASVEGAFEVEGLAGTTTAVVLGESRKVSVTDGKFRDAFKSYEVHLYKVR